MGRNTFIILIKDACVQKHIDGEETKQLSTSHGLRRTPATSLFKHGHSYSSVAIRTDHRVLNSLNSNQNIF